MNKQSIALITCCAWLLVVAGCSRQQTDWQKARESNTAEAYAQFAKKYPGGEFTAQAQARLKELQEEHDWQKARDADTPEAYQAFLRQYPDGKWTEEARIRVENFTLAQAPGAASPGSAPATVAAPTPGAALPAPPVPPEGARAPATITAPPAPPDATAPAAKTARSAVTPAPSRASTPAPSRSPSAVRSAHAAGGYGVQLGAFKSGPRAASVRWALLKKQYPRLLAGLSSKVAPKKTPAGALYRLQAVGLSERRAREVCDALKAKSQSCMVVAPVHG